MDKLSWLIGSTLFWLAVAGSIASCERTYNEVVCEQFCAEKGGGVLGCNHVAEGRCACSFVQPESQVVISKGAK